MLWHASDLKLFCPNAPLIWSSRPFLVGLASLLYKYGFPPYTEPGSFFSNKVDKSIGSEIDPYKESGTDPQLINLVAMLVSFTKNYSFDNLCSNAGEDSIVILYDFINF